MDDRSRVIRPLEVDDYRDWHAIMSCPGVQRQTLQLPSLSLGTARKRLEGRSENSHSLAAVVDGRVVGQGWLQAMGGRRSHVGQPGVAVHDDYLRQGIGEALLAALIDLGENWLGLTRLELEVYTDNAAAIALYQKLGFVIEGTKRRYAMREGALVDAHCMARLSPRP
jgi:putative acetyltransferase